MQNSVLYSDEHLQTKICLPPGSDAYDSHQSLCLAQGKIVKYLKEALNYLMCIYSRC